jgi:beta-glucosidase
MVRTWRFAALASAALGAAYGCGNSVHADDDSSGARGGSAYVGSGGGVGVDEAAGATADDGGRPSQVGQGGTASGTSGASGAATARGGSSGGELVAGQSGATESAGGALENTGGTGGSTGGTHASTGGTHASTGGTHDGTGGTEVAGSDSGAGGEGAGPNGTTPPPSFMSPECQSLAANLLGQMTLGEKAAQMIQVDAQYVTTSTVASLGLGSVLASGDYWPGSGTSAAWRGHIAAFHSAALASRLQIPLLYGLDAVHGMSHAFDAIIYPHNLGLGASHDPELVERVAHAAAVEVAASGADWTFAPVLAAARDERWGRTYESFSEDPALAGLLGARAVTGFQGQPLGADRTSILASAKHFAGDGDTDYGSSRVGLLDQGNVSLSDADFRALAVAQYAPAIRAGVGSIMVSYSSYQGTKMSADGYWLTSVLKGELGFDGFLISDYNAVDALSSSISESVATAVNAGLDMLMETSSYSSIESAIVTGVQGGLIDEARVDDAVTRILRVKCGLGLFERAEPDSTLTSQVGSAEHRALAREAVQKSVVLLKNEHVVLPLSKSLGKLVVAGSGANTLSEQMGGWTLNWQGSMANSAVGTTLLDAVSTELGADRVEFQSSVADPTGADAVLLVVGERPYAEYLGDTANPSLGAADSSLITSYAAFDVPVIVVLYSGRPLVVTNELAASDAFLAAFLPGSAAEGIADILFGDVSPTATLSMSWPATLAQIPINVGDADYASDPPLFPIGFGLEY